ncbi:Caskin-1 [Manis pentadactyla]|nr:Caskin-1 [Manis pentadactyla]
MEMISEGPSACKAQPTVAQLHLLVIRGALSSPPKGARPCTHPRLAHALLKASDPPGPPLPQCLLFPVSADSPRSLRHNSAVISSESPWRLREI